MTSTNNINSESISIPISYSGAYLFQAPHRLELIVDKQLVVVFCLKGLSSTGLVLSNTDLSIKDLLCELELLHLKIKSKLKIHTSEITLKIFGLSHGAIHVLEAVQEWANSIGIKIVVTEIGKRTIRNISVDCLTGKVGVTYGELNNSPAKLIFLSEGTARKRIPLAQVHNNILILTRNAVQQQLTKAAIEEYPAWAAITVDDISQFINSKSYEKSNWSVVLCFEDLINEKGLEKFITQLKKSHPSTQIRWVGSVLPEFSKEVFNLKLLPPMDYELLPDFKKMLKRAVFESNLAMNFEAVKISAKKESKKS